MAESIIVKLYVISAVQRFGGFEKGKKVHFGKEFDKRIVPRGQTFYDL